MIKAEELRIGNYVSLVDSNSIVPIRGVDIAAIESGTLNVDPIFITNEYMERFGFIIEENEDVEEDENGVLDLAYKFYIGKKLIITSFNGEFSFFDEEIDFSYVHELQNIFFALKKEELILKNI